ncbi:MAG: hypothetical protein MI747_11625 [Desulfobacterales bacterium]|nr:hypothetical protein [Desulfobacterales bacterium]
MRNAFAREVERLAGGIPELVLLSGDIGNRLFDPYKDKYPDRFYNCGVAEANMTTMAAGMALEGHRPVTYTIAPFNTSRCFEQIKIDLCYPDLPVVVVGVGAGLSYAGLGATHHAFEDVGILRTLPNMHIVCPCDALEVEAALAAALELGRPVYLRLGKKNEPRLHSHPPRFSIGRGMVLEEGRDLCLVGCGTVMPLVVEVAQRLAVRGIRSTVVNMHTVKPLDTRLLGDVFSTCPLVCTLEEHSLMGGLGSAVTEWAADGVAPHFNILRFGIPDEFIHGSGTAEYAREMIGLTPDAVCDRILERLAV